MLYNNDDFEKLFRKAAKGYPLKTDSANWEQLAAKLDDSKKTASKKNKWKYSLFILLPVLIIGSLSVYKFNATTNHSAKPSVTAAGVKGTLNLSKTEPPATTALNKNVVSSNQTVFAKAPYLLPAIIDVANANTDAVNGNSFYKDLDAIMFVQNKMSVNNNAITGVKLMDLDIDKLLLQASLPKIEANAITAAEAAKSAQLHIKPQKRIYGVAYGGPELTTIKFQRASTPGYRLGVALGYKINDRLNIEIGLQRERLDFYSDGKYIDTGLLRIQKGNDVERVYASGKITSVPLKLKYNFWQKKKSSFFIGAGVNAVIITHSEHYNYAVSKNGVKGFLSRKYNALTTPKYFSGISFSGGYQTRVAGSWSVKAEPYYQTPVKNFGVGKIPVSNFGIDIGIIKDLK